MPPQKQKISLIYFVIVTLLLVGMVPLVLTGWILSDKSGRELRAEVGVAGQDSALGGQQGHVVEGEPLSKSLLEHQITAPLGRVAFTHYSSCGESG